MEEFEGWLTKVEVIEQTRIPERTLERRLKAPNFRKAFRKLPSQKPVVVIHPEEVEKLRREVEDKKVKVLPATLPTAKPPAEKPAKLPQNSLQLLPLDLAAFSSQLTEFVQAVSRIAATLDKKSHLSLKEASECSGLPQSFLRRQIKAGILPAVKVPGWRIWREDIERYNAASGKVAG